MKETAQQQMARRTKNPLLFLHILLQIVKSLRKKRVPALLQMNQVECGLACLAMILSYYGRKTSVVELRARYGVGRDALSALSLVRMARDYGLRVRAISLQHNEFRYVTLPAIIHWEFNHFLVVERWSKRHVDVVDPARGRRRLTSAEFDTGFTGVVLVMEPGVNFARRSPPSSLSLKTYAGQFVRQAPGTMVQVLIASLFLQLLGLAFPTITEIVVDHILPYKMSNVMTLLALGMIMLLCSQVVISLLREWLLIYLRARVDISMMFGFFEHLLTLPYSFFQQRSAGDLLTRMASNTVIRDALSNQLISTLLDCSTVLLYLYILLAQSVPYGLLTLAIGLLQAVIVLCTYRPIQDMASRELAAQGKTQGYLAEALSGIATIKAAGAEARAFERWSNLFFEQLNISLRRSYFSTLAGTALTALRSLSPLALLWVGALEVLHGSISVGAMLALNALAAGFLTPLASLVGSAQQLQSVQANLARLADIMTTQAEQDRQAVAPPPRLTGNIRLENVSFQYAPAAPRVLHHISLSIRAGQKVAIVGRTGSGKSTLGKLLLALYLPTEGTILYDGIPLQHLQYQEVRRQFGVVLQDSAIFSGSILHNITLNNPSMSREEAKQAAWIAAIHEDIMHMPMGYDTQVAEGGSALSGGQRQRLAIARAVAHHPAILLLDEATSNLDVVTERQVAHNLQTLACTQIIIAHRLSTVRSADLILVMDKGTIVECGSHHELLSHNGYYTQLIRHQLEQEARGHAGSRSTS